jgi:hypothetical protein
MAIKYTISALLLAAALLAQRRGGEIRERRDNQGREYFEVFADHSDGNHGFPVPMDGNGHWAKAVDIRAESAWTIFAGVSGQVTADGKGPGSCAPAAGDVCAAAPFPRGGLIARWVILDTTKPPNPFLQTVPTEPLTDWFFVGKQASIPTPIPDRVHPRPFSPPWLALYAGLSPDARFRYTPLVALQYLCNEYRNGYGDNDGWLHVYQQWTW